MMLNVCISVVRIFRYAFLQVFTNSPFSSWQCCVVVNLWPRENCEAGHFGDGSATHSLLLFCFKDPFSDSRVIREPKIEKRNILTGRCVCTCVPAWFDAHAPFVDWLRGTD